jgi:hypothetical protein
VFVKVFHTSSPECRVVQQLLGEQPWCKGSPWEGTVLRLWETLHFVPLATGTQADGLVHLTDYPEVAALAMKRLVPLYRLADYAHKDVLVLLYTVKQLAWVRCPSASYCLCSLRLSWV